MTMISVEKDLLFELVDSKLHIIREEMEKILLKWNYKSIEKFIKDTKDGTLKEAEDDAVVLRGLVFDQDKVLKLKKAWAAQ